MGCLLVPARSISRLVRKIEVDAVFRTGRKAVTGAMVLFLLKNNVQPAAAVRYAIRVPKKYGTAVERNRVKRIFREAISLYGKSWMGYDMVVFPRPQVKGAKMQDIAAYLQEAFSGVTGRGTQERS